ncbi:MAG: transposase [Gemmatimonadetes bacterium]|nr:transposase [Gemmatimonadota bacterium]
MTVESPGSELPMVLIRFAAQASPISAGLPGGWWLSTVSAARRSSTSRRARTPSTGTGFDALAPVHWTDGHVSPCHGFRNIEVRLRPHALAHNLGNFLRTLVLPEAVEHWSPTTLREKLIKIGPRSSATVAISPYQLAESPSREACSPTSCA